MKTQYLFCSVPYNLLDVPLGSFVPDLRYPNQDALSVITAEKNRDYTVRGQQDFKGSLDSTSKSAFMAQITRLLNLSCSRTSTSSLDLTAKAANLYELKKPQNIL
jgi:hypothetical protein